MDKPASPPPTHNILDELTLLTAVMQYPERKNTETLLNFLQRALEMVLPGSWTWEGRRALQLYFWLNHAPMH